MLAINLSAWLRPRRNMVFHNYYFYSTILTAALLQRYISISHHFRSVHSQVRQPFRAFSPWVFYRPPAYRQHHPPLDSFPQLNLFGLLSADFTELLTFQVSFYNASRSIREGVSGRYSFIPPFGLSVHYKIVNHFGFVLLLVPQVFTKERVAQ